MRMIEQCTRHHQEITTYYQQQHQQACTSRTERPNESQDKNLAILPSITTHGGDSK
jgi:hypothetical protein